MGYDGKIMRRALQHFERDKARREDEFEQRRETLYRLDPRLRQIDRELRQTMSRLIATALRKGTDPRAAVATLRNRNLTLQRERADILTALRQPADALELKPACYLCGDTGYDKRGKICHCLRNYYASEQKQELSHLLDLGNQSFDTFDLSYYSQTVWPDYGISPRENMQARYESCVNYACHFGEKQDNLLMFGPAGLGKTHLSAGIAREVSDQGFSVVYDTAAHIFSRFEAEKFGRDEDATGDVNRMLTCDLLILDDLGTEMLTSFVQSALYRIVNTRLMEKRDTIISTNLEPEDLGRRYSPQIASRIEGEYRLIPFFGEDIRRLKRLRNK